MVCGRRGFFDKRSDLGKVFPSYFQKSYWNPSFSCPVKDSTKNQVDFILKKVSKADPDQHIFLYLNVDAIHYPNYFYLKGAHGDSVHSHAGGASLCRWRAGKIVYRVEKAAGQYICDLLFGSWHLLWGGWLPVSRCQPSQLSIPFPISISLFDAMTKQQGVNGSSHMKR